MQRNMEAVFISWENKTDAFNVKETLTFDEIVKEKAATMASQENEVGNDVNNNTNDSLQFIRIISQPVPTYKMRQKGDRKTSSSLYSEHKETIHDNKYPKIEVIF